MSKRAASMKAVKPEDKKKSVSDDRTPKEYFDEAKMGLIAIVDSYERNASRPDQVLQELAHLKEFDICDITTACTMIEERKSVYSEVRKRLSDMTFDSIVADEWDDPFKDMLEYIDTSKNKIHFIPDIMCKWARFDSVRPFGEKVEQLRMTLLEKSGKSE